MREYVIKYRNDSEPVDRNYEVPIITTSRLQAVLDFKENPLYRDMKIISVTHTKILKQT